MDMHKRCIKREADSRNIEIATTSERYEYGGVETGRWPYRPLDEIDVPSESEPISLDDSAVERDCLLSSGMSVSSNRRLFTR